ncbi:MAG: hypothetical protein ACREEE_14845 [Dongiaceae bacterium]
MTDQALDNSAGAIAGATTSRAPARPAAAGSLIHPAVDFMLVGGLSVAAAVVVFFFIENQPAALPVAALMGFVLSDFINYPHFAHSYQIMYGGIWRRILGTDAPRKVRLKYVWAGFVAPAIIAGFLLFAYLSDDARTMGLAANGMLFFVGWHYVKQGYGVLIVLSAIRRIYYTDWEKKLLLLNGYAVWIYSWLALNDGLRETDLFGMKFFTFGFPHEFLTTGAVVAGISTAAVLAALGHRVMIRRQPISWSGALGYGCSLYLWVIARYIDPVYAIFVPMFHSLQYLLFVWRYELNKIRCQAQAANELRPAGAAPSTRLVVPLRFAVFVALGIALGWIGFIGAPDLVQRQLKPDPALWGPSVIAFMFIIWINIHHYFIDNVIWRKDNEDVRKFLFAPR